MKKTLHKILCLFFAVMMFISVLPMNVFAYTTADEQFYYGFVFDEFDEETDEICINGKVQSSDARDVLRSAARIQLLENEYAIAGDADCDGKVISADARKILRRAAGMD